MKGTKDYTYYTKGVWVEKKERAYKAWLNYVFSPTDTSNLSSLNSKRLFAKIRGCVAKVYHKDEMLQAAMVKVEASISTGLLKLLTDSGFLCTPRLKRKATKTLLSYDPLWLKLGLETVFRKKISPKGQTGGTDVLEDDMQLRTQLTTFVEEQFFTSPELEKKLRKNVKKRGLVLEELAAVVLKRFLLLVILLDRTLTNGTLPDNLPLLFDPTSKIKSSSEMIKVFLKGSLFGEGDTVRQLEHMGYSLKYSQGAVLEFDYRVSDIRLDFRDGIRSCKLAEILLDCSILPSANFNTLSNAVKVYNVKLALKSFSDIDKSVKSLNGAMINPQDLVDGHGETTIGYLWNVALMFQIPRLVTVGALVFEILQVKIRTKSKTEGVTEKSQICFPTGYNMRLALLLSWVQTVVNQYGATVKNYKTSFADGSVLCYLICHYLPAYMNPDSVYVAEMPSDIKEEVFGAPNTGTCSSISEEEFSSEDEEEVELKKYGVYSGHGWMNKKTFRKHREGIVQNFSTVFSIMRALGGIPETISASDFEEQGPEESAVQLYVAFMCARLLQVSKEERAALTIQKMWKIYKGYSDPIELIELMGEEKKPKTPAAPKRKVSGSRGSFDSSFTAYEYHRRQYNMSRCSSPTDTCLSGFEPAYVFIELKDIDKVVNLQAQAKGAVYRRRFIKLKKAVKVIEDNHEMIRDRGKYLKVKRSTEIIQKRYKGAKERKNYTELRTAANIIKAYFLCKLYSKRFLNMKAAVVIIQKNWRRYLHQSRFLKFKTAAIIIQKYWRGFHQRTAFLRQKQAAIKIQAAYKMYSQQMKFLSMKDAAITIQSSYLAHFYRCKFLRQKSAVLLIESYWQMQKARDLFLLISYSVVEIQAMYKMHLQRNAFNKMKAAAVVIQTAYRRYHAMKSFQQTKAAALVIQREVRAYMARSKFRELKSAAIVVQSLYKMSTLRKQFLQQRQAAIVIQRQYRILLQGEFRKQTRAAVRIQARWKGLRERRQFLRLLEAVVIIQRATRLHQKRMWLEAVETRLSMILVEFVAAMERTHQVVKATIILQAYTRGYLDRKKNSLSPSEIKEIARERLAVKKIMNAYRGYKLREEEAEKKAAVAVLEKWSPVIKERSKFLKKKKAVEVIQKKWKTHQKRREKAASLIQKAFQDWKVKLREMRRAVAAKKIQASWKGYRVRAKAPKEIKRAASRIRSATRRARLTPSKTLGARCKEAVQIVKNNTNVEPTFMALASLEMGTMYSQGCCEDLVSSRALVPLLRIMTKCNRSAEHQVAFARGLTILKHLCKYNGLTRKVFKAADCLETLSERMQYYRDCPAIFLQIVEVFRGLMKVPENYNELSENVFVVKQLNSVWSLLSRKVDIERKYIIKLEADKASDTAAKRATEKAFIASNQLVVLGDFFEAAGITPELEYIPPPSPPVGKKAKKTEKVEKTFEDWRYEATEWRPKNMIAKEKIKELRTVGVTRESSTGPVQKKLYINPVAQKQLKGLGSDAKAEALERRTNVRLMSDARNAPSPALGGPRSKKPVRRSGSVGPSPAANNGTKMTSPPSDSKLRRLAKSRNEKANRSFSLAPEEPSRIPSLPSKDYPPSQK
eukprot:g8844.t1